MNTDTSVIYMIYPLVTYKTVPLLDIHFLCTNPSHESDALLHLKKEYQSLVLINKEGEFIGTQSTKNVFNVKHTELLKPNETIYYFCFKINPSKQHPYYKVYKSALQEKKDKTLAIYTEVLCKIGVKLYYQRNKRYKSSFDEYGYINEKLDAIHRDNKLMKHLGNDIVSRWLSSQEEVSEFLHYCLLIGIQSVESVPITTINHVN